MKKIILAIIGAFSLAAAAQAAPTAYIQSRSTLQSGTTIYVTSGTIQNLIVTYGVAATTGVFAGVTTSTITASSGTITLLSVSSLSVTGILGTTTNDNAPSNRDWGFYISSGPTDLRNYPTSGNYTDLASFSLPAGDWDVVGCCLQNINGSTTQAVKCGTSSTSGNSWPEENVGYSMAVFSPAIVGSSLIFCGPPTRWSLSGTTTIYTKSRADYTVGTPNASGFIRTRRAR